MIYLDPFFSKLKNGLSQLVCLNNASFPPQFIGPIFKCCDYRPKFSLSLVSFPEWARPTVLISISVLEHNIMHEKQRVVEWTIQEQLPALLVPAPMS